MRKTYTVLFREREDGTVEVRIPTLGTNTTAASMRAVKRAARAAIKRVHELYAKSGHEPPDEEGCEILTLEVDL